jgi:hypothetical protein
MTVMALGVNDEPDVETIFPQRAVRHISPVAWVISRAVGKVTDPGLGTCRRLHRRGDPAGVRDDPDRRSVWALRHLSAQPRRKPDTRSE